MITVIGLPAFNDNYIWMLVDSKSPYCFVVDPGDGDTVIAACHESRLSLGGILITHHHADHTGGIAKLTMNHSVPVYGPAREKIKGITHPLSEGDRITIFGHSLKIFETPGHTAGHISYFGDWKEQDPVLFCGDTLFAGGCGRLFEGTARQMRQSLTKLAGVPGNTLIYCAHEYTQANLAFAREVEPANNALAERYQKVVELREKNRPTVPSIMADELDTNPFMRSDQPEVKHSAEQYSGEVISSADDTFAAIRRWKDNY